MMYEIENRSPLLDSRLRSFISKDYRSKVRCGWTKFKVRRAFSKLIDLPTHWRRQKQDFRWDGSSFLLQNKDSILDLVSQSACLRGRYNVDAFISQARKDEKFFRKAIVVRLLCIAGLEETLGMGSV